MRTVIRAKAYLFIISQMPWQRMIRVPFSLGKLLIFGRRRAVLHVRNLANSNWVGGPGCFTPSERVRLHRVSTHQLFISPSPRTCVCKPKSHITTRYRDTTTATRSAPHGPTHPFETLIPLPLPVTTPTLNTCPWEPVRT
jgi:hypothetical protein